MELFTKSYERATLRKLWRPTKNSSLLPAKCWQLLHVIRACSWRWPDVVAIISARFSILFLFRYVTKHLITDPMGNSEFFSLESQSFPRLPLGQRLRFCGNKISCFPRGRSLSVNSYTYSNVFFPLFCLFLTNCSMLFHWLNKITLCDFFKYP